MARPKRIRKIQGIPAISGFTPYGYSGNNKRREAVFLFYEEYESLRLCDYEKLNHLEASTLMGVSRPTLTRIYSSAREKMALAMVEGRKIIIEGGKVALDDEWLFCNSCGCYFNKRNPDEKIERCELCGSKEIEEIEKEQAQREEASPFDSSEQTCCGRRRCQKRRHH